MAKSIKLADDTYISSDGIRDESTGTTLTAHGWKQYGTSTSGQTNYITLDLSSLTNGVYAFRGNSKLSYVVIRKWNTSLTILADYGATASSVSGLNLTLYTGNWGSYAYYRDMQY